jgi:hypothetical protein
LEPRNSEPNCAGTMLLLVCCSASFCDSSLVR